MQGVVRQPDVHLAIRRTALRRGAAHAAAVLLTATAFAASALAATDSAGGTRANPYLAQSYNNQTHGNDAGTNSVSFKVPRGNFEVTPESAQILYGEACGLPLVTDTVADKNVYWWWAGFSLRKLILQDGKLVEVARSELPPLLPGFSPVAPEQRAAQAKAVQGFLDAHDEPGLLAYMKAQPNRLISQAEDQLAGGAIYSMLDRDNAFYAANSRSLFRIAQQDPKNPLSPMSAPQVSKLPDAVFDNEKVRAHSRFPADMMFGLGMTYNGYIVANTVGGKVLTLDRKTLELVDTFTVPGNDELFLNSFATGPEANNGAVYVASNANMYRLVVDRNGKIHADKASGAWQSPYDRGVVMPAPKVGDGTGSTPSLMGFGPHDDKLVVITDGARKMRLVAFWRDQIPADWKQRPGTPSLRVADQRVIDMGPEIETVQSEQAVASYGDYAFVVNNIPTREAPQLERSLTFAALINGATRPGPRGVAAMKWEQATHSWKPLWTRDDISTISMVPIISGGGHMAIIDGYFAGGWNDRYHIGMDLDSGKTVMTIREGSNPVFNGMFAGVKVDDQGRVLHAGAFGLMRLDTAKMKKVAGPEDAKLAGRAGS